VQTFGRYALRELIAAGGMAEVWRAEVEGPGGVRKELALKLVRGGGAAGDFGRMLVAEARLAARLSHANVVQVYELLEEGGRHAIAMELVRGRDLGRVQERCRELGLRLGLPRAVLIAAEVAKGLAYAHRASEDGRPLEVVHRDVSPHNILLSYEGEVKLTDFGIARAASLAGLTDPGVIKGKFAYMAPEQARGEPVDARADVFSLGVVLWELCAGRRLFARETEAATLAAVLSPEPVSPPSAWNEAVPTALDAAVLAALANDPARRTPSAGALVVELTGILLALAATPEDLELRSLMGQLWPDGDGPPRAAEPTRVRPPVAATAGGAATRTVTAWPRRRLAWALGLGLAVAAGGGALLASRDGGSGGQARLLVNVTPWATVLVDGRAVGETPRELSLPAGRHRLRVEHPTLGSAEVELELAAGAQESWLPTLRREESGGP
jgi:serine/threonine-protein kinase